VSGALVRESAPNAVVQQQQIMTGSEREKLLNGMNFMELGVRTLPPYFVKFLWGTRHFVACAVLSAFPTGLISRALPSIRMLL
jgi:hypothetical protein